MSDAQVMTLMQGALETGPHQIEIGAPGLEPQFFDVYVDPTRTVDLHGDLLRDRY